MLSKARPAPDFCLPDQNGSTVCLADFKGRTVLLIFYPGDNTPVCTKQLCDYRDNWGEFSTRGIVLLGISTDPVAKHHSFREEYQFPFPLLADTGKQVCRRYGALSLLGTAKRAYVLIGPEGKVLYSDSETFMFTRKSSAELVQALEAAIGKHKEE